jgi:apolipoprotein N-acyltransferase
VHASPVRAGVRLTGVAAVSFEVVLASSHLISITYEYLPRRTGWFSASAAIELRVHAGSVFHRGALRTEHSGTQRRRWALDARISTVSIHGGQSGV